MMTPRITIQTPSSTATSSGKQVGKANRIKYQEPFQVLVMQMIGNQMLRQTLKLYTPLNMHSILQSTLRSTSDVREFASRDSSGLLCLSQIRVTTGQLLNAPVRRQNSFRRMQHHCSSFYWSRHSCSCWIGSHSTVYGSNSKIDRYTYINNDLCLNLLTSLSYLL